MGPVSRPDSWWVRPILVRPPILIIALVGVFLVGFIAYKSGVSSAQEGDARRQAYSGGDAPGWNVDSQPILHSTPGERAEVRRVTDAEGVEVAAAPVTGDDGWQEYPVIIIASALGRPDDQSAINKTTKLMAYVQMFTKPGYVQLTELDDRLAIFVGPFDTRSEAEAYAKDTVRRIKPDHGSTFKEAYVRNLEFTAEQIEKMRRH